jgi:hypothetical protein
MTISPLEFESHIVNWIITKADRSTNHDFVTGGALTGDTKHTGACGVNTRAAPWISDTRCYACHSLGAGTSSRGKLSFEQCGSPLSSLQLNNQRALRIADLISSMSCRFLSVIEIAPFLSEATW